MQIVILKTPEIKDVPDNVEVIQNWGYIEVFFPEDKARFGGDHIMIEGTIKALIDWLKEYDGVLVGKGAPILQRFEIEHIK